MHVHLIGVAGTGMGALAGLLQAAGHRVSGSDIAFYPPMGDALVRWGIETKSGFSPANLSPTPDLVIVGNVCRKDNVEARHAIDSGMRVVSMPGALEELFLSQRESFVVAGTHGKTTTTTIVAYLLHALGKDPGLLVGGIPLDFGESFRVGGANAPFVIEGDEYDSAFFEKTPKFWHYRPEVAILTSIEHDHVDIYPSEASYLAAFSGFVERVPAGGLIVAAATDRRVVEVVRAQAKAEVAWFALEGDDTNGQPPHWLGAPAGEDASGQAFDLYAGGVMAGRVALKMPGHHNVRNALAAIAAATQGYGVPLKTAISAMASFTGVRRRQDLLFVSRGVSVYDDFAHHPTAVEETLRALRSRHPEGALWAVFEARSATACRAIHQEQYARSFGAADRVIFAPLGRTDIPEGEQLDLSRLVREIEAHGSRAETAESVEAILETITREAKPGDTVALLSNGAFGGIHEKLRGAMS